MGWLAVLLVVGLAELPLSWYTLVGPVRFEHAGLGVLARVGRLIRADAPLVLPNGATVRRVDAAGMYQRAINVEGEQGVTAAEGLYSDELLRKPGADVRGWLTNQAPHLQVQAAWQIGDGVDGVEVGWATSNVFRGRGLQEADGLYRIDIRDGEIASQQGILTATTQAWLIGQQTILEVRGWPTALGRAMLALLIVCLGGGWWWLLCRGGIRQLAALAIIVSLPVATTLMFTLVDDTGSSLADLLPDAAVYRGHAVLASVAEHLGDKRGAALQWAKATRHVQTPADMAEAASGLVRDRAADLVSIREPLCTKYRFDPSWVGAYVVAQAGIDC